MVSRLCNLVLAMVTLFLEFFFTPAIRVLGSQGMLQSGTGLFSSNLEGMVNLLERIKFFVCGHFLKRIYL